MKFNTALKLSIGASVALAVGIPIVNRTSADSIPSLVAGQGNIPRTDVVDVASYQANLSVADFQNMKKAGVKGVIVKLTEGTTYKNPYAATQIANARTAGLVVGAYHYSHFTSDSGAKAEANYFADAANSFGLGGSTYMADDLEDSSTKAGSVQNNAMSFANQLKSRGYSRPMLYTYQSYVEQTGLNPSAFGDANIWIASCPYAPSADANWYPQYGMWQFNSNTHFPGVSGGFDVSIDNKGVMGGNVITDVKDVMKVATFGQSGRNDGYLYGGTLGCFRGLQMAGCRAI